MARPAKRRKPMGEINVVPYIDVMLVLLVIFMITAPLLQTGVEVALPQADAKPIEQQQQQEPLLLSVDQQGRLYLNLADDRKRPLSDEEVLTLATAALRLAPKRQVLVRGDQRVDYGLVVRAMALLQRAGAEQVGLVTEPES